MRTRWNETGRRIGTWNEFRPESNVDQLVRPTIPDVVQSMFSRVTNLWVSLSRHGSIRRVRNTWPRRY